MGRSSPDVGRLLRTAAAVLTLAPAAGCGAGTGSTTTQAAPTAVPTDYRQLLPGGSLSAAVVSPLCRRLRRTFAHAEARLRPRLARLDAAPTGDARTAYRYVRAHRLAQTDEYGAFSRRVSRLADERLRELAGRRAGYVNGSMVHDFLPNAIAACRLERAYDRVSRLGSRVDLRVTDILVAAAPGR